VNPFKFLSKWREQLADFINDEIELFRLKGLRLLAATASRVYAVIFVIIFFNITLVLLGLWLGFFISGFLDSYALGFGFSALFFVLLLVLLIRYRRPILIEPFEDLVIRAYAEMGKDSTNQPLSSESHSSPSEAKKNDHAQ
jgi:signal transduction histidine kinase